MKTNRKALLGLTLFGVLFGLVGCQQEKKEESDPLAVVTPEIEKRIIPDKYRNMYQIFPISFSDSNGDGKGDLRGIIEKLDYLESMNYTGVWLCPIHPSGSAHHYDVRDYKAVASEFGAMATFDLLVKKLHERGMTIILDLVINHSSDKHEWFEESYSAAKAGKKTWDAYKRYCWVDASGDPPPGYVKVLNTDNVAYEARFSNEMPDFNIEWILSNPECQLAKDFKDIFKFWLVDHNIDGFRLDAVTHYVEDNIEKNTQFMTWLNTECKKLKPDCYIVGEGNWGTNSQENKTYQSSGIDSFFQFGNAMKNSGYVQTTVNFQNPKKVVEAIKANAENAAGGIEAPFLDNHDVPRYVGAIQGRETASNAKFALGILQQLKGATFTYYGDEVGMASQSTTVDGFYRLPIRWGEGDTHTCQLSKMGIWGVPSDAQVTEKLSYPHPSVAEQEADPNSILNYAKKANLLRLQFPELARGDAELLKEESGFDAMKRTYKDSTINVLINGRKAESYTVDFSTYGSEIKGTLCASGEIRYTEVGAKTVVMPPQSIMIVA